jgi:hypothetical protein
MAAAASPVQRKPRIAETIRRRFLMETTKRAARTASLQRSIISKVVISILLSSLQK